MRVGESEFGRGLEREGGERVWERVSVGERESVGEGESVGESECGRE